MVTNLLGRRINWGYTGTDTAVIVGVFNERERVFLLVENVEGQLSIVDAGSYRLIRPSFNSSFPVPKLDPEDLSAI